MSIGIDNSGDFSHARVSKAAEKRVVFKRGFSWVRNSCLSKLLVSEEIIFHIIVIEMLYMLSNCAYLELLESLGC